MQQTSPTQTPKAPAKKKQRKRRARRATSAAVAKPEHAGMTAAECATACRHERCVVSHKPYCAHPAQCGLNAVDALDPAAVMRLEAAKKHLAHLAVERKRD